MTKEEAILISIISECKQHVLLQIYKLHEVQFSGYFRLQHGEKSNF